MVDSETAEAKSLRITAYTDSNNSNAQLVPVNTSDFVTLDSRLGSFKFMVDIKNFKGSKDYNETNSKYTSDRDENLVIKVEFKPVKEINGAELIFGNDFDSPIKDYLPYGTSMGLRIFNKFVDPSCEYDLYCEKPWIYGKCLSSFNKINVSLQKEDHEEEGSWDENIAQFHSENEELSIPEQNGKRQSYFTSIDKCKNYTFLPGFVYRFEFSNDYLSLKDNKLGIALPGGFELNLIDYLSKDIEKCCNFVLKKGDFGLIIKFEYV